MAECGLGVDLLDGSCYYKTGCSAVADASSDAVSRYAVNRDAVSTDAVKDEYQSAGVGVGNLQAQWTKIVGEELKICLQEGSRGIAVGEEEEVGYAGATKKIELDVRGGERGVDRLMDDVVGEGSGDRGGNL